MDLRTANVTRYILPLREGGSLPALAEADDEFKYVVKFRGAGHGTKALIAELEKYDPELAQKSTALQGLQMQRDKILAVLKVDLEKELKEIFDKKQKLQE